AQGRPAARLKLPCCRRYPLVGSRIPTPEVSGHLPIRGGPMGEKPGKVAQAYEAEAAATRAKTEKLRALRLAREAELAVSRPAPAPKKAKGAAKEKAAPKAAAGNLADWMKAREEGGHNN